jgi:hypothetical protein
MMAIMMAIGTIGQKDAVFIKTRYIGTPTKTVVAIKMSSYYAKNLRVLTLYSGTMALEIHAKIIVFILTVRTIVPEFLLVLHITSPKETAVVAEKEKKFQKSFFKDAKILHLGTTDSIEIAFGMQQTNNYAASAQNSTTQIRTVAGVVKREQQQQQPQHQQVHRQN